jgi:hypothetical protein
VGDVQGLVNAIREMFKSAQNVKEITDRAFNMATSITVEENIKLIQNTYSELLDLSKQ